MSGFTSRRDAWMPRALASVMVCLSMGVQAQGSPACKSPDEQLPPEVVERWVARQVTPTQLLGALARASSNAVWVDEIAISAGQALVKGHAEAGDPKSALAGLVHGLQRPGSGVRGAPNATWLDAKGMPSQEPVTPKFLLNFQGTPPTEAVAGRSVVPCAKADAVLSEIVGRGRMIGGPFTRFGSRQALAVEDGVPIQFVDLKMTGTFASLTRALMAWEAMPFAMALDGVVIAPLGDELEVALTIKIVRGVSVAEAPRREGPVSAAVVGPDPFRVAEAVRARRLASPSPPCQDRAKAWQAMAEQLSFLGVMPPLQTMGLLRLRGSDVIYPLPAGQVHAPSGARAVSFSSNAAELEIAEMVDGECRLRLISLPKTKP